MQSVDPRAIRTKKLLIDAFNQLIKVKDFNHISVKDITALATVNRATFYAHFIDKYALLDEVLTETTTQVMQEHFSCHASLTEQTISQMFLSIVQIHDQMHTHCRRGYNTFERMIEEKVKEQLTAIVLPLLTPQNPLQATMFSWSLYGAYTLYTSTAQPAETFAKQVAQALIQMLSSSESH